MPQVVPGVFGVKAVPAEEFFADGRRAGPQTVHVVDEDVLSIEIDAVGTYALMWTPTEDNSRAVGYTIEDGVLAEGGIPESLALAAGFAFTEGIVDRLADIAEMAVCAERPDVVRMRLVHPEGVAVRRRNVVMNSSCGVCGGREQMAERLGAMPPLADRLRMKVADFTTIREAMHRHQGIFGSTGGAHGAALFDAERRVVAVAEDIGRHNALDKVLGYRFLAGDSYGGCGAFISSRVSYEMVAKAARAGLDLLAGISAPTSLAIEMAERFGITLCGFVRGESAKAYTHTGRIVG